MTHFSELGEFGLIERIRQTLGPEFGDLKTGIGDDCAVIQSSGGKDLLFTTDALVEGVHFDMAWTPDEALGWKALAVNLSDIAAMGGEPLGATISIALPESWSVERVDGFYRGLRECSERYGCPIAGGDTVKSTGLAFISIAVLGRALNHPILRSGAKSGDLICVTGSLGGSRTGWESLSANPAGRDYPNSIERFLQPLPRLDESRILLERFQPTSMIDISDGLSSELIHLCRASGTGCVLREVDVPVIPEARKWAEHRGLSLPDFVMNSGEEYELLFTAPPERGKNFFELVPMVSVGTASRKRSGIRSHGGHGNKKKESMALPFAVTVIGEMTAPEIGMSLVSADGKSRALVPEGWDHFEKRNRQGR